MSTEIQGLHANAVGMRLNVTLTSTHYKDDHSFSLLILRMVISKISAPHKHNTISVIIQATTGLYTGVSYMINYIFICELEICN